VLGIKRIVGLTIRYYTDHNNRYEREGKYVRESPEPEPPPCEIGMTSFIIRKGRLDYEASIHVEVIEYQHNEAIACANVLKWVQAVKRRVLTQGSLLVHARYRGLAVRVVQSERVKEHSGAGQLDWSFTETFLTVPQQIPCY
jgi:hypothetical protein